MSLTTLLSVAIALSFAYFLLSSVASAINEAIGAIIKRRPNGLRQAILAMVGGDDSDQNTKQLAQRVYDHSLVSCLSSIVRPSYVPARNFTRAVVDVLVGPSSAPIMSSLQQAISDLPPDHPLTQALRSAATEAQGDFEAFKTSVDKWFDDAMDRLSGVYKRNSQIILFAIGLGLAVGFNVDTVHIVGSLLSDKPTLANVVEAATRAAENIANATSQAGNAAAPTNPQTSGAADAAKDAEAVTLEAQLAESKRNIAEAIDRLRDAGLPIGWQACAAATDGRVATCWNAGDWFPMLHGWGGAVLGWLLTAIAVSIGAPFWFDLLNTFVNIRAAGPKPKATNKSGAPTPP